MSLTADLEAQADGVVSAAPPEILDTMERGLTALTEAGVGTEAIGVGDRAPDFTLPRSDGVDVSLSDLLASGPVIIDFYRGGWCPYCNLELRDLQAMLPDFADAGATLVAVSPQVPDESLSTTEKAELAFPVLSDVGSEVTRSYGLVFALDAEMQQLYGMFGNDLERINGTDTWELPVPATYVVGTDGVVTFAFVDPDYRKRAEPAEVLANVRSLA